MMIRILRMGLLALTLIAVTVACGQPLPEGCSGLVKDPQFTYAETGTGKCYALSGTVTRLDTTRYAQPTNVVLVVDENGRRTVDVLARPEDAGNRIWQVGDQFDEVVLIAPLSGGLEVVHFYLLEEDRRK